VVGEREELEASSDAVTILQGPAVAAAVLVSRPSGRGDGAPKLATSVVSGAAVVAPSSPGGVRAGPAGGGGGGAAEAVAVAAAAPGVGFRGGAGGRGGSAGPVDPAWAGSTPAVAAAVVPDIIVAWK